MTQTEKLSLNLIAPSDLLDPGVINANFQTLDEAYTPTNPPCVVGSYTGSGGAQTIELGFAPSFVLVNGTAQEAGDWDRFSTCAGCGMDDAPLRLTDSGFTVRSDTSPVTNQYERPYVYIAFR